MWNRSRNHVFSLLFAVVRSTKIRRMNRRQFLSDLAVLGAGALAAGSTASAQRGNSPSPRRIDFHHHFELQELLAMGSDVSNVEPAPRARYSVTTMGRP